MSVLMEERVPEVVGGKARTSFGASGNGGAPAPRGLKSCPRCGAKLFEDMDVCFACLFDFSRDKAPGVAMGESDGWPALEEVWDEAEGVPSASDAARALARPMGKASSGSLRGAHLAGDASEAHADVRPVTAPVANDGDAGVAAQSPVPLPAVMDVSLTGTLGVGAPPVPVTGRTGLPGREMSAEPSNGVEPETSPAEKTMRLDRVAKLLAEAAVPSVRVARGTFSVACPVGEEGLSVGRDWDNDVIVAEPLVSRHHLRLFPRGRRIMAEDLEATNPTTLNGHVLMGSTVMREGDVLEIAGTDVRISLARDSGSAIVSERT